MGTKFIVAFFLCLLHLLSEQDHSDIRDERPWLIIKKLE